MVALEIACKIRTDCLYHEGQVWKDSSGRRSSCSSNAIYLSSEIEYAISRSFEHGCHLCTVSTLVQASSL